MMIFLLRRDESWGLVNGEEFMLKTPIIRVLENLEEREIGLIGDDVAFNSSIINWKNKDQSKFSIIAFYFINEPL
jgi:hypothetical protein